MERGFTAIRGHFRRCCDRLDNFELYKQKKVFSPDGEHSTAYVKEFLLFLQLQMPSKTEIDAVEFIEGAKEAVVSQTMMVNSMDLAKYLIGETSESTAAERLQTYSTPGFYNMLAMQVKRNYKQQRVAIECLDMSVESAYLQFVDYNRLTEDQYKDEVEFMKHAPAGWAPDATLERLRLHIDVATVEDLKLHFLNKERVRVVQQQNTYRFVFESRVTRPDEVEWRVANIVVLNKRAIEHPASAETEDAQT